MNRDETRRRNGATLFRWMFPWMFAILEVVSAQLLTQSRGAAADMVVPREDWDRAFQRTDGWTGGDADYAIELDGKRTLWLFADSWIGSVRNGAHALGSRMVNNSIALHTTSANGQAPAPDSVKFHWGDNDSKGQPTAWIVPDSKRVRPRLLKTSVPDAPTWYWIADGIMAPSENGSPRLLVFLWHIGKTKGTGVWTFASVGGALAVIDNPQVSPENWRILQYENPHFIPDAGRELLPSKAPVTWGASVLLIPRKSAVATQANPWLYIYGTRSGSGFDTQLVLARVASDRAERFDEWEFRASDGWTNTIHGAATLANGMVSEFSISPVAIGAGQRFIMVQSQPLFGTKVMVRIATSADDKWGEPFPVYQVPGVDSKRKYFTYAAKAHPHLSRPGSLLVSYILNSHDFAAAIRDANIYRPRFIELDVNAILASNRKMRLESP